MPNKCKQVLFLLSIILMVQHVAWSQGKDTLGDIKYSLLPPESFVKLHGKSWVLIDGRNIQGSKLAALGLKVLPDARGIFLRGMNEGRDKKTGDEDGDRELGSSQGDRIKSHTHKIDIAVTDDNKGESVRGGIPDRNGSVATTQKVPPAEEVKETNPRNIAVYIYVKIN